MLKKLLNNKYFEWTNVILIGILFLFITIVDLIKVANGANYFESYFIDELTDNRIWIALASYVVFVPGLKYFKAYAMLKKKKLFMDFLIVLAMHISYIFSVVSIIIDDSLPLILEPIGLLYAFNTAGEAIESFIAKKNDVDRASLDSLKLKEVMMHDGTMKKVTEIKVGDIVMFHTGEIIQFDGVVHNAEASFDTSNINGESKPYFAKKGSNVISGTKLVSNMLNLRVIKSFEDSTLNKLVESIKKTNNTRPKMQNTANKINKIFIPSVLLITILTFIVWMILSYVTDIRPYTTNETNEVYNAFFVTVSVLAISCPCAMTMAAPLVSYVSAQYYWRNNVVFNKPEDIEKINKATYVVLDKTGTITTDKMNIVKHFGKAEMHKISSALEHGVYHPIANAIYNEFKSNIEMTNIKNLMGKGVQGQLNGKKYLITGINSDDINKTFNEQVPIGTYVGLFEDNKLVAAYVLTSIIKQGARELIKFFKSRRIKPIILSGDNEKSTKMVADKLKVEYRSSQTPEDKAKFIKQMQSKGEIVMMIGDGLNDSIAIKAADVSITFAQGSEIANGLSSLSLLSEKLSSIIYLFKISKKHKSNYLISLFWAVIFNLALIPFAAMGFIPPWASTVAMYGSNMLLYISIFSYWFQLRRLEIRTFGKKTSKKVEGNDKKMDEISTHEHMSCCH